ncbi:phenylalanine 4-monooxygenase [Phycicoccus flavus]|uniref:phenylalanine 4-monooxygenase n=1 Tax=Phycicoccus flavus TaxID=2502783 RepID=UPI000FEB9480|nr:phenylalanine 4-monooxygenase [Phycicoccus flavus]NHA68274.1 phenylalanine 4-monooxygenase [Phycicoccus flavus]
MFEEGQLYSAVTTDDDGTVQVHLADNHPGLHDAAYRARRGRIAGISLAHRPGEPVPTVEYDDDEHGIWRTVCTELSAKHERYAHPEFLAGKHALGLPTDHVPQLHEVTALLEPLTGWSYTCAPGLVPLCDFYGDLGRRVFNSTQYLRHGSRPLYTPEPDIIHEVVGHGNQLASPRFAAVTEAAGQAVARLETDDAVKLVADVFWFSMEFGVMADGPELKAYGAGILSSYGEMDEFRAMEIRPLDLADMGTLNYDITAYQPVLFRAEGVDHLEDVVGQFFATVDDDGAARLRAQAAAAV